MIDLPPPRPNRFQRLVLRLAAFRLVAWTLARLLPRLDRFVLRLTAGDHTATSVLSGLPVLTLTTTGARSGMQRTHLVLGVRDGQKYILFPTNFGSEKTPAWLYNLIAFPKAALSYRGQQAGYRARQASEDERPHYWAMADAMYPGYAAYRKRIHQRQVPVMVLEPAAVSNAGQGE